MASISLSKRLTIPYIIQPTLKNRIFQKIKFVSSKTRSIIVQKPENKLSAFKITKMFKGHCIKYTTRKMIAIKFRKADYLLKSQVVRN